MTFRHLQKILIGAIATIIGSTAISYLSIFIFGGTMIFHPAFIINISFFAISISIWAYSLDWVLAHTLFRQKGERPIAKEALFLVVHLLCTVAFACGYAVLFFNLTPNLANLSVYALFSGAVYGFVVLVDYLDEKRIAKKINAKIKERQS